MIISWFPPPPPPPTWTTFTNTSWIQLLILFSNSFTQITDYRLLLRRQWQITVQFSQVEVAHLFFYFYYLLSIKMIPMYHLAMQTLLYAHWHFLLALIHPYITEWVMLHKATWYHTTASATSCTQSSSTSHPLQGVNFVALPPLCLISKKRTTCL